MHLSALCFILVQFLFLFIFSSFSSFGSLSSIYKATRSHLDVIFYYLSHVYLPFLGAVLLLIYFFLLYFFFELEVISLQLSTSHFLLFFFSTLSVVFNVHRKTSIYQCCLSFSSLYVSFWAGCCISSVLYFPLFSSALHLLGFSSQSNTHDHLQYFLSSLPFVSSLLGCCTTSIF